MTLGSHLTGEWGKGGEASSKALTISLWAPLPHLVHDSLSSGQALWDGGVKVLGPSRPRGAERMHGTWL